MARKRLDPAQRRSAILAAAHRHFTTSPFAAASVPAIAADAGASQSLVFHYFGTKAGLFTSLIDERLTAQRASRDAAVTALDDGQPRHYRIEVLLLAHLDAIADDPLLLTGPGEPEAARDARRAADRTLADTLSVELDLGHDNARHRWAVTGIVGFLSRAAADWAARGCSVDERRPLIEATIGALGGALGDWGG